MKISMISILLFLLACLPAHSGQRQRAAAPGAEMKVLNPDISAVVDTRLVFSEDKSISGRDEFRVEEIELVFQAYVYPGVFGNIVLGMHEHGDHRDVDAEEAYLSFYELPWGLQADVGRKLVDFGRINPVHRHAWHFASFPLAYENIFGDHPWSGDGLQLSKLVPNPWDRYINLRVGWWSGDGLEHRHDDDNHYHARALNGNHNGRNGELDFHGSVYTGRLTTNLFYEQHHDALAGVSMARDSDGDNSLYGFDLTYRKRWPFTQRRFRWQNEVFMADTDHGSTTGFYSLAQLSLNNYWDVGIRYDWTELLEDDDHYHHALNGHNGHHHHGHGSHGGDTEWAVSLYATHRFSETVYLRPELRYHRDHAGDGMSTFMLQFVWGFGPHAHPLED